jgi:2'-hydroxyisoflavone reductase
MKILVLGGTAWVGSHIAAAAIDRGHHVTCLARGSRVPVGAELVIADRDDEDALVPVMGTQWDAVIDVARQPVHVVRAIRDLEHVTRRYVFVSTGNVYASQERIGVDETAERMSPLEGDRISQPDDYGPAKVACEDMIINGFGQERSVIARAGLIAGPGDPTGRTDYWPWRFAHPAVAGKVLAPEAPELPSAVIDVRDLAEWLVHCVERDISGVYNAMGPSLPFPEHLEVARQAARSDAVVIAAPEEWLQARGVDEWSGPRSMPLWLSDRSWYGMNGRSVDNAHAAGLRHRPLVDTLRDSLQWRAAQIDHDNRGAGLSDDEERELLDELTTRSPAA